MNAAEPECVTTKPRLRWYQCGRRFVLMLLFAMLIFSFLGVWSVHDLQRERRQDAARGSVAGQVYYSTRSQWEEDRSKLRPADEDPWNPRPGDKCRGLHCPVFADGFEVNICAKETNDASLVRMHLQDLSPLRTLNLSRTQVTDSGLSELEGLDQLRALDLSAGKVTDTGLRHVEPLRQLQWLDLGGTKVTDVGLSHLQRLTQLQWLDLGGTKVTDVGLSHLQRLTQLQWLNLRGTKVSDPGLEHLTGLTELQRLLLDGTQVTDKGRAKLQKVLPKCKIIWSPPSKDARVKSNGADEPGRPWP